MHNDDMTLRDLADEHTPLTEAERGARVGWELAHEQMCGRGKFCSAHQPISADAQRGRLAAALAADDYLAARTSTADTGARDE